MSNSLRTPAQAKEWLESHGVTAMDIARRLNVPRWAVDDVLRGRGRFIRGDRHKVAVALGIKPAPMGEPPFSLDAESPKASGAVSTHAASAA